MPYDILQLNDMLVPELVDVAEHLKINNARTWTNKHLIYKILDQQALGNGRSAPAAAEDEEKSAAAVNPKQKPRACTEEAAEACTLKEPQHEKRRNRCSAATEEAAGDGEAKSPGPESREPNSRTTATQNTEDVPVAKG